MHLLKCCDNCVGVCFGKCPFGKECYLKIVSGRGRNVIPKRLSYFVNRNNPLMAAGQAAGALFGVNTCFTRLRTKE